MRLKKKNIITNKLISYLFALTERQRIYRRRKITTFQSITVVLGEQITSSNRTRSYELLRDTYYLRDNIQQSYVYRLWTKMLLSSVFLTSRKSITKYDCFRDGRDIYVFSFNNTCINYHDQRRHNFFPSSFLQV